jgi:hypothetical protein
MTDGMSDSFPFSQAFYPTLDLATDGMYGAEE